MLIMGQIQLTNSASVQRAIEIPSGAVSVVLYNTGSATVWLGSGTAITTSNGLVMHTVPTSFQGWMTGQAAQLYALTAGTAASFNYILMTDQ
jgi:hypothetical protein